MSVTPPILDTHQHLIYADRLRYPIAEGTPALAGQSFTYENYVAAAEGTGIEATLFMETTAEPWQEELALVHGLSAHSGSLISGIVAQCPLETATEVEPWLATHHEKLRGIRRICHTEPDGFALGPEFISNVGLLGHYGIVFDLCFLGRQLADAFELAKRCPKTQMVLDHCGIPDIAAGEWASWRRSIGKLATLENVNCKISGVLAYCRPGEATLATVRPYIEHCIACFGPERVVWGSDWPFCRQATTLLRWVDISRELLRNEPEENQRKLFRENALRIYGCREQR